MSTSTDRYKFQTRLETLFNSSGNSLNSFRSSFVVTAAQEHLLKEDLKKDCQDFYYKGLYSMVQAFSDIKQLRYSWATVQLYYSVFYQLRATLAIRGIGFFRKDRELLALNVRSGNQLRKCYEEQRIAQSDHKATLGLFKELYGDTGVDILQSNQIDYLNSYKWLAKKREWVNYVSTTFPEPACPIFWEENHKYLKKNKLVKVLEDYFNDGSLSYCFQPEHACLALPIHRFLQTRDEINGKVEIKLTANQIKMIQSFKIDYAINRKLII